MSDLRPEIARNEYHITPEGMLIDSLAVENVLKNLRSKSEISEAERKGFQEMLTRMQNKYVIKTSGGYEDLISGFKEVLDFIRRYIENWPDRT